MSTRKIELPPLVYTHYHTLGVRRQCTAGELKVARRALALKLHPDLTNNDVRCATAMALVNVAHDTLADPARRKLYDAGLRTLYMDCGRCFGEGGKALQRGFKAKVWHPCGPCAGTGWVLK